MVDSNRVGQSASVLFVRDEVRLLRVGSLDTDGQMLSIAGYYFSDLYTSDRSLAHITRGAIPYHDGIYAVVIVTR